MRLIDADAFKEYLRKGTEANADIIPQRLVDTVLDIMDGIMLDIDEQPTIDAVPVVRCKDCEWYVRSIIKQDGTLDKRYKPDWCDLYRKVREETYFCADGERRDDEIDRR